MQSRGTNGMDLTCPILVDASRSDPLETFSDSAHLADKFQNKNLILGLFYV